MRINQKQPIQKKSFFLRCAQVTLGSHLVENFGLPCLQTLKNTGERRGDITNTSNTLFEQIVRKMVCLGRMRLANQVFQKARTR